MIEWIVRYWDEGKKDKSSLERWFDRLTNDQLKSVAKEVKLLGLCGTDLKLPHSRALGKGLFELRERRYGYRIYYAFEGKMTVVLLNAGDKSSQAKDIPVARLRLADLLENQEG